MPELLYKLLNMWKKNISFLLVFFLFLISEIPYITSIQETCGTPWYKCINYFYVFLWSLPTLVILVYIIFMRNYMPKAKKNTKGIVFYIINANEKQYEAITKKFIAQFEKAVLRETPEYSVVVIDDYHSKKYYSILCDTQTNDDGQTQAKILQKRRGCIAILIDCINGGDGEDLFCHMTTRVGVTHQTLSPEIRDYLVRDISIAFYPLRNVDIMKLSETSDLSNYSISMDVICKYILASTCFHCGDFQEAINLLEIISNSISAKKDLPDAIIPIKNVLSERLAVCYKVKAQFEYNMYCMDHNENHLVKVREAINNKHCKAVYGSDNKILEGICCFVLEKDVKYALKCMDSYNKKNAVIKYNKIFLLLYSDCTANIIGKAYNIYKSFETLSTPVQDQIEAFTYHEYQKDNSKKQLLLILFFIYDYQNNMPLAKRCLDQFSEAFPWIKESGVSTIFEGFNEKYANINSEEGEGDSI